MPRSTTLWAFEPVKYCSAAPNDSSGTTRRSTWSLPRKRTDIFVGAAREHLGRARICAEAIHHFLRVAW